MRQHIKKLTKWSSLILSSSLVLLFASSGIASAAAFTSEQSSGSVGLEGTISTAPPAQGATITTPVSGSSFTSLPITVNGLCPKGLLVKIFSNNVFVGSEQCATGSYSIQVDLFGGENDLVATVYDALDQAGPDSNTVHVNFNDAQIIQFGTQLLLTSAYAKRGADPGTELDWPIILSGGTGPYAISIDWADGSPEELISEAFAGTFTAKHTYKSAGIYNVIVKATDTNGTEAFLQLVGVADGAIQGTTSTTNKIASGPVVQTQIEWWPAVAMLPLIAATFWIGRRHELFSLRRKLEKNRNNQ